MAGGSGSAGAGGGGGSTSVLRNGSKQLIAAAGGGGGAGNADTCCAFGGTGGGERGGDGGSPGFEALASLISSREGYKDVCHGGWCSHGGSQVSWSWTKTASCALGCRASTPTGSSTFFAGMCFSSILDCSITVHCLPPEGLHPRSFVDNNSTHI